MDAGLINWPALVEAFRGRKIGSGEIKPTTWTNTYVRRMRLILAAVDRCQTPVQLLEAITAPWANQPGCRGRQLQVQQTAALLRWGVDTGRLPATWAPPLDLTPYVGRRRETASVTTPLTVPKFNRWWRRFLIQSGAMHFSCSPPMDCARRNCSTLKSATGVFGATTPRSPVGGRQSHGRCGCCPAIPGLQPGIWRPPSARIASPQ